MHDDCLPYEELISIISNSFYLNGFASFIHYKPDKRRVGLVVRVSSHAVGRGFAHRSSHTKDHYKWHKLPPCMEHMRDGRSWIVQPDCLKVRVVCGTVYMGTCTYDISWDQSQ